MEVRLPIRKQQSPDYLFHYSRHGAGPPIDRTYPQTSQKVAIRRCCGERRRSVLNGKVPHLGLARSEERGDVDGIAHSADNAILPSSPISISVINLGIEL
jgi:hypothetical protein